MQRFFVTFPLSVDIMLTDLDMLHQLTRVLRIQKGEHIVLFDGDGSETEYEIGEINKKSITLRGVDRRFPSTESKKNISLYQALPNKYEKIEYIIQKGVEIGIKKFVFFRSERSQKLIISPAKIARFELIAKEAVEQCGGVMASPIQFIEESLLVSSSVGFDLLGKGYGFLSIQEGQSLHNIVLDTTGENTKLSEYANIQDIGIWVGPEGGWSDTERLKMIENGFIFARFGERVFRTETTGIVVAFALLNI